MGIEPDSELIWKYIRGECTTREKSFIETLIKNDINVRDHYQRLLQYQEFLNASEERQNADYAIKDSSEAESYNPYYRAFWILVVVIALLAVFSALK